MKKDKTTKNSVLIFIGIVLILGVLICIYVFSMKNNRILSGNDNHFGTNDNSKGITMSKASGCYNSSFDLKISAPSDIKKIFYTTDGSDPRNSSARKVYKDSITISERNGDKNYVSAVDPVLFDAANATFDSEKKEIGDMYTAPSDDEVDKISVIRAVGSYSDNKYTSVATNTYIIGNIKEHIKGIEESTASSGIPLSIMSISVDYDSLFDEEKGIYVKGKKFEEDFYKDGEEISSNMVVNGELRGYDANYKQRGKEWERYAHVDYFESDGEETKLILQQDCGLRVQGNFSRSDLQKGLRIYAREDYTPGLKNFEYSFFEESKDYEGKSINKYKKLTLRNGGNSAFINKFNDQYWQNMVRDLNVDTQHSRPCIVYIDGEYFGLYVLQEDYCGKLFEERYNVLDDSVVSYKGDAEVYTTGYTIDDGELPAGETDEGYYLKELLDFYSTHKNLKKEKDFKDFCKLVDPDSVRDYFAVELWINNQWDWPGKNWLIWRATDTEKNISGEENTYADGRWRFCFCDLEFGGWCGESDAVKNTIKEDNYQAYGMLDMNTNNVVVLMFAYLYTNDNWRADFEKKIYNLSKENFNKKDAMKNLDYYYNTYFPLFSQFYSRYYGKEQAFSSLSNNMNSGGGGYKAIEAFINEREKHIEPMIKWAEKTIKKLHK